MLKKTLFFHEKPSKHLTVLFPETATANIKIYEQIRQRLNPTDSDPQIFFLFRTIGDDKIQSTEIHEVLFQIIGHSYRKIRVKFFSTRTITSAAVLDITEIRCNKQTSCNSQSNQRSFSKNLLLNML